jgi:hypothetical protein
MLVDMMSNHSVLAPDLGAVWYMQVVHDLAGRPSTMVVIMAYRPLVAWGLCTTVLGLLFCDAYAGRGRCSWADHCVKCNLQRQHQLCRQQVGRF